MKALIVDDEKHVREAVKLLIDWSAFHIDTLLEADNGAIAAQLIAEERPELILVDMMMPVRSGSELLEWIEQHAPQSKTIVISGHNDFDLVRHTMRAGGLDYILKPIDADQLHDAIRRAVRSWQAEEEARLQNREKAIQLNISKPAYWDKRLSGLIHDPGRSGSIAHEIRREFEELHARLEEIHAGLRQTLGGRFHIGVGRRASFPSGLPASYAEAAQALRRRNVLAADRWIHTAPGDGGPLAEPPRLADYEERLTLAVQSADARQIREITASWFDAVRKRAHLSQELLISWEQELRALFVRWRKDAPGDGGDRLQRGDEPVVDYRQHFDEDGKLLFDRWRAQWIDALTRLAQQAADDRQERDVMREIADYINRYYHKDLTLQSIADRFYLSREYISRKFKQEQGENISDYIGRVRIGKAKLLLLNPHLKIVQIAAMVGYQDEKYFSKVFKKIEGVSPNAYRRMNS